MRSKCIDASLRLNLAYYSILVLEPDIQRFLAESERDYPRSLEKIESRYQLFHRPQPHQEKISNASGIYIKFAVAGSGKTRALLEQACSTNTLYMTSGLSATGKEGDSDGLGHELRLGCQDTTLARDDIQRMCESQPSLYFDKCANHIGSWNSDLVERIHRALLGSRMEVFRHFEVNKASPQKWLLFQLYCAQTENIDHFANIYRLIRHM
jgi:hypothetical protein